MVYAWVQYRKGKMAWKPVKEHRQLRRGKNKGAYVVMLATGRKRISRTLREAQ